MTNGNEQVRLNDCVALLDSVRSRGNTARIAFTVRNATHIEAVVLKLRNAVHPVEYSLPFTVSESNGQLHVNAVLEPGKLALQEIFWEVFASVDCDGEGKLVPIKFGKRERRMLYLRNQQWRLADGKVLFTHVNKQDCLSFVYRDYYPRYDTYALRIKEFAALGAFTLMRPYWKNRRIWLVYEKFCKTAQDNGFYFFEYCMGLPEQERAHIFYVIDEDSPDLENVRKHGKQVIRFMSFKHLLYSLAANLYIASDSKMHLYVWRSKPSLIRHAISRHKLFFLQHGVTALKRVDQLFGAHGSNPATYFLTTSENEQSIVTEHFGYAASHAPVLGFSRWDALEDRSSSTRRSILLMPTWRPWLEEQDDETFVESDYYAAYSELIQNEELGKLLERHDAVLKFFIHPKLSERLHTFVANDARIELIPQGSTPLNQLLMECDMLVTDYSSVCWDMLFMGKPVVFYQFDRDVYEAVVGSYIDLKSELPGDSCLTSEDVIASIEKCAARGYAMEPEHEDLARSWFAYRDTRNSERTYAFIVEEGF